MGSSGAKGVVVGAATHRRRFEGRSVMCSVWAVSSSVSVERVSAVGEEDGREEAITPEAARAV